MLKQAILDNGRSNHLALNFVKQQQVLTRLLERLESERTPLLHSDVDASWRLSDLILPACVYLQMNSG